MLKTAHNMILLMDDQNKQLKRSLLLSLVDSLIGCIPFIVLYFIVLKMPEFTSITKSELNTHDMNVYSMILVGIILSRIIIRYFILYNRSGSGYKCMCKERKLLGEKLRKLPLSFFNEKNVGDLVTTITSDAAFLEIEGIGVIEKLSVGLPAFIIGLLICLMFDVKLFGAIIILCVPTWFSYNHLKSRQQKLRINRQEEIGKVAENTLEFLKGINVIKTYNMNDKQFKKTKESYEQMCKFAISTEFAHIIPAGIFQFFFRCITVAIIYFAGRNFIQGKFNAAQMMILMFLAPILFTTTEQMGIFSIFSNMTQQSIDRMNRIKHIKKRDQNTKNTSLVTGCSINFNNVEFGYGNKPVLKNISFNIQEKTSTALVGLSGSGKTTIFNLIARFWDIDSGEIKIGDKNIKALDYEDLMKHISIVFQECFLFNDTALNNLRIGRLNASLEEVYEASKIAGCHDFICSLPNGYNTNLGESGARLSGGEKQRICIARALIKNAPIVLLDEMTANIDIENETKIHKALEQLLSDKTVIVIAHKLTSIKQVDQILVLDHGTIKQKGTHIELLRTDGLYKKLWDLQYQTDKWNL